MIKRKDQDCIKPSPNKSLDFREQTDALSRRQHVGGQRCRLQGLLSGEAGKVVSPAGQSESPLVYHLLDPGDSKPASPSCPAEVSSRHYCWDYLGLALLHPSRGWGRAGSVLQAKASRLLGCQSPYSVPHGAGQLHLPGASQ